MELQRGRRSAGVPGDLGRMQSALPRGSVFCVRDARVGSTTAPGEPPVEHDAPVLRKVSRNHGAGSPRGPRVVLRALYRSAPRRSALLAGLAAGLVLGASDWAASGLARTPGVL